MKKATKVVLGAVAGLVMLGTFGMSVWLVMRWSVDDMVAEVEVKPVALAEMADGEVDLDRVQELYERPEVASLQGVYEGELGELEEDGVDASRWFVRRLEQAEKEGNKVYLYERILTVRCQPDLRVDEEENWADSESSCGVLEVAATCGTPEFGWSSSEEKMTDEEVLDEAAERGLGLMKWTFELEDGRYVYRGMERMVEQDEVVTK